MFNSCNFPVKSYVDILPFESSIWIHLVCLKIHFICMSIYTHLLKCADAFRMSHLDQEENVLVPSVPFQTWWELTNVKWGRKCNLVKSSGKPVFTLRILVQPYFGCWTDALESCRAHRWRRSSCRAQRNSGFAADRRQKRELGGQDM